MSSLSLLILEQEKQAKKEADLEKYSVRLDYEYYKKQIDKLQKELKKTQDENKKLKNENKQLQKQIIRIKDKKEPKKKEQKKQSNEKSSTI